VDTAGEPAVLPRGLAGLLRPELATVSDEIITEIRRTVPEYARPLDGPYGHAMRIGVEQALLAFVDHVADPGTRHERRDDVCRKLGHNEALEGRSLDSLQSAYRVGARVAWQRLMRMGRRHNLSSSVMSLLADALFGYIDELASLSHDGYVEAQARSAGAVAKWRRRLLHLLLESPAAPTAHWSHLKLWWSRRSRSKAPARTPTFRSAAFPRTSSPSAATPRSRKAACFSRA